MKRVIENPVESSGYLNRFIIVQQGVLLRYLCQNANGDAVVISAGPNGDLVYTCKPPGEGNWVAEGFSRSALILLQDWLVQLVKIGNGQTTVKRMELNADNYQLSKMEDKY